MVRKLNLHSKCCNKSNPITRFQEVEAPRFQDNRHMKVVRLSALRTGLYSPGIIPGTRTHFSKRLSQPQGHSAAGRIISMKHSSDTIGNRNRDLPACSTVPQPNAPPRTPNTVITVYIFHVLPTQCTYVFCVDLRTNSYYFTSQY
jgi:hypothetical protein